MHEFFRGWRRKFGVATLAVACALTVELVRSESICDIVSCDSTSWSFMIRSIDRSFEVRKSQQMPGSMVTASPGWLFRSIRWRELDLDPFSMEGQVSSQQSLGMLTIGNRSAAEVGWTTTFIIVPYWLPIAILSLLSGNLLFPRSTKANATSEGTR